MKRRLAHIALLVRDYNEAIDFYVGKLGFILIEDSHLSATKRWVIISPGDDQSCHLLLAKASGDAQLAAVGNQSGGRVFLFMYCTNLEQEYNMLKKNEIKIVREPIQEAWGKVLVFEDLYGNLWDLIEPVTTT